MIIKEKEERNQLLKAFKTLLIDHDLNTMSFCRKYNLNYRIVYERLNRNNISEKQVNEMIHLIDKKKNLQLINKKLVIW